MAMKVAIGTKPSSPTTCVTKTVVAKKASGVKSKIGNNRQLEIQRTGAPLTKASTSTATPSTTTNNHSSRLATFAMSSRSTLTKRITQPSLSDNNRSNNNNSNRNTYRRGDSEEPETNLLVPKTTMDDRTSSNPTLSPMSTSTVRSVWYLGGNQLAQLLTSVEGDLDPVLLAKIAEVPSVVGDLALSVESLVSDDLATIGGFETDLLAQIASNTLASRHSQKQTMTVLSPFSPPQSSPSRATTPTDSSSSSNKGQPTLTLDESSTLFETDPIATPAATVVSPLVPNPLAHYDPVPNPLARITPPVSPLPTTAATTDMDTAR